MYLAQSSIVFSKDCTDSRNCHCVIFVNISEFARNYIFEFPSSNGFEENWTSSSVFVPRGCSDFWTPYIERFVPVLHHACPKDGNTLEN